MYRFGTILEHRSSDVRYQSLEKYLFVLAMEHRNSAKNVIAPLAPLARRHKEQEPTQREVAKLPLVMGRLLGEEFEEICLKIRHSH